MRADALRRWIACALVAVLSLAALAALSGPAHAAAPPAAPGCVSETRTFEGAAASILANVTNRFPVDVTGLGSSLYHVALTTRIDSAHTGDLSIALVAPEGRTIAVRANDVDEEENVFDPTVWEDSAPEPGAKTAFENDVPVSPLEPDQAFAGLDGIDPNGAWQLAVTSSSGALGELIDWSLELSTCQSAPSGATFSPASAATVAVPAVGTALSTISASGLPCFLESASVRTDLSNSTAAAITMSLISPTGESVVLTHGNGGGAAEVFSGTLWEDAAPTRVTNASLSGGEASTPLEPQQGLSRLIGENPNGAWTLELANDSTRAGTLHSWSLNLLAGGSCTAPNTPTSTGTTATPEPRIVSPPRLQPPPAKPTLTHLELAPGRFDVRLRRGVRHELSGGTHISFTLNAAAVVRLAVRSRGGKREGTISVDCHAGANTVLFTGKLRGRFLSPGRYRVAATPTGGTAAIESFTIL